MKASYQDRASEFLSEEDLDLANLSWDELILVWNNWLAQAQATNDQDHNTYEHGVFTSEPSSACTTSSREP